jgi:hypothetical protein
MLKQQSCVLQHATARIFCSTTEVYTLHRRQDIGNYHSAVVACI